MEERIGRLYKRISDDDQSTYSLDLQEEQCRALCKFKGYTKIVVYTDEGKSAKDLNRPAMKKLRREVRPGDLVVIWKFDRLSRNTIDMLTLVEEWNEAGVGFASCTESVDTSTPSGKTFLTILASIAEMERENIRGRVYANQKKKAELGLWVGGKPAFGLDAKKGILYPNEKAPLVFTIFEDYLNGGTIRGLAINYNNRHIKGPRGAQWTRNTISAILKNPVYYGANRWGQRGTAGHWKKRRKTDAVQTDDAFEGIVSKDMWDQVQLRLQHNKKMNPKQVKAPYPLTGILRCGVCGGSMGPSNAGAGRTYYRCSKRNQYRGCDMPHVQAKHVDAKFLEHAAMCAESRFLRMAFAEIVTPAQRFASQRAALEAEARELKGEKATWDRKAAKNLITDEEWKEYLAPIKARLREIDNEMMSVEQAPAPVDVEMLAGRIGAFLDGWEQMDAAKRKAIAHALFESVTVQRDGSLTIVPRGLSLQDDTAAD